MSLFLAAKSFLVGSILVVLGFDLYSPHLTMCSDDRELQMSHMPDLVITDRLMAITGELVVIPCDKRLLQD